MPKPSPSPRAERSIQPAVVERELYCPSGYAMFAVGVFAILALVYFGFLAFAGRSGFAGLLAFGSLIVSWVSFAGIFSLEPNTAAVLTLFGRYVGTAKDAGLFWTNPFYASRKVSMRRSNFASEPLKVNDQRGNPIEIAAAIEWSVADCAAATFGVEDHRAYLAVCAESALRDVASTHPYDNLDPDAEEKEELDPRKRVLTLRGHVEEIAEDLVDRLQARVLGAGIDIHGAKLTHLAYAPEIAGAMLRRQQAEAVLSARRKIVQGAVEMADQAVKDLRAKGVLADELPPADQARIVGNLLVVLCSDRDATPVVDAGSR